MSLRKYSIRTVRAHLEFIEGADVPVRQPFLASGKRAMQVGAPFADAAPIGKAEIPPGFTVGGAKPPEPNLLLSTSNK